MAPKKLWLTHQQAYFHCLEGVFSEDAFPNADDRGSHNFYLTGKKYPIDEYSGHLENYSYRSLTFQSDVYNAFTGITNIIYGADILAYGLPRNDFDQALLWVPLGVEYTKSRVAGNTILPSWSWASIDGPVSHPSEWGSFCGTLVQWRVCIESEAQPSLVPINADNTPASWNEQEDFSSPNSLPFHPLALTPSLCMALAWVQRCIRPPVPVELHKSGSLTFAEIYAMSHALWPSYDAFYRALVSKDDQNFGDTPSPINIILGSLLGQAQTAMLDIIKPDGSKNDAEERAKGYEIRHKGLHIGLVNTDLSTLAQNSVVKVLALSVFNVGYPLTFLNFFSKYLWASYPSVSPKGHQKFERDRLEAAGLELLQDRKEDLTFFDCDGTALLPPPMLRLMLVEKDGPCYRRIGLGWAYMARWVKADPQFEAILLR